MVERKTTVGEGGKKEVVILGGGFAGLAAGVELAARGHHVTLFEKKGRLGGRAYSFRDPATGSLLDNGQHVFLGCYRETLRFLDQIGRLKDLPFQRNLKIDFAAPGRTRARFRAWPAPSPWHLIGGLFSFPAFSLLEKWNFQKVRKGLSRTEGLERKTIPEWLGEMGQSPKVQKKFWDLLAYAALNDRPEISSAALFRPVIQEALFSGRRNSRIGIPAVGLSELYADPAREFIESHGGHVFLKTPAIRLHFSEGELEEIELQGGRRLAADLLVVALPFTALRGILPEAMIYHDPFFHSLRNLQNSPIVSINLWFDREIVASEFVGLWETRVHWLFNKGRLFRDGGSPYLTLVISGAREELKIPGPQLVEMAVEELKTIYPRAREARLLHSHVMKEPEATLAPLVGVEKWRLPQKTPYRNLYLAGDWTDTGLPATIEGAVRSAHRVVEMIEEA